MSSFAQPTFQSLLAAGQETLRKSWGWLLAFGIVDIVLGLFALSLPWIFSIGFTLYVGIVLMASGVVSAVEAFRTRTWGCFFLALFTAILDLVVGFLMFTHGTEATAVMTLLLATFFFVGGLFRVFFSLAARFPNWGWSVLSGLVGVVLGAMIWEQWPYSSFWVIGVFVGVQLVFRGWTLVMLSMAVRPGSQPTSAPG